MKILAKSRMAMFLVMVAASGALFAQSSGPDKPQSHASVLDARQIVGQSVAVGRRATITLTRHVMKSGAWTCSGT